MRLVLDAVAAMYFVVSRPRVLDVGALDVNGCYRPLFHPTVFDYVGLDCELGPNVDVTRDIYSLDYDAEFDLVISGQTLEHLEFPLLAAQRMKQAVKPGGYIVLVAPNTWSEHRYPLDCWRVWPDGMRFLLEGFEVIVCRAENEDTIGVGRRPTNYRPRWEIKENVK